MGYQTRHIIILRLIIVTLLCCIGAVEDVCAQFPWYTVDSIYNTRQTFMRYHYRARLRRDVSGGYAEFHKTHEKTSAKLDFDPIDIMLTTGGFEDYTHESYLAGGQLSVRLYLSFKYDADTYQLFLHKDKLEPMYKEVRGWVMEEAIRHAAIIDSFIAHGYTPFNIAQRLAEEKNLYLDMPLPFFALHQSYGFCNWVFTGITTAAWWRFRGHPFWDMCPQSRVFPDRGPYVRELPPGLTPEVICDSLNISLGTFYFAMCEYNIGMFWRRRDYFDPTIAMCPYYTDASMAEVLFKGQAKRRKDKTQGALTLNQ